MIVRCLIGLLALTTVGCAPSFYAKPPPGAPAGARFVRVSGIDVHYTDSGGGGPAVVLAHGFGSSLEIWNSVVARLAPTHRVIALDLKGFGYSGRPVGDYSPAAQAELIAGLLDELGIDKVSIVSHSWGSSVALAFALAHPRRVRKLALYSAYVYEAQVPSFFLWARVGGLGELLFALYYTERIEDRVPLAYHDRRFATQQRVEYVERELERPGAVAAALASVRGQRYTHVEKLYGRIGVPVLLLWGREDRVTPLRFGERLSAQLPNATLKVYPQCGHVPMIEAVVPSTRDLVRFLAKDSQ